MYGSLCCVYVHQEPRDGPLCKIGFLKVYFILKYFKIFKSRNLLREERLYIYFKTFDIQENTPIFTINPLLIH